MIGFKEFIEEENTQGDVGTDKLSANRKKATPGELPVTPEPLKGFETFDTICNDNFKSNKYSITQSH